MSEVARLLAIIETLERRVARLTCQAKWGKRQCTLPARHDGVCDFRSVLHAERSDDVP